MDIWAVTFPSPGTVLAVAVIMQVAEVSLAGMVMSEIQLLFLRGLAAGRSRLMLRACMEEELSVTLQVLTPNGLGLHDLLCRLGAR